MIYLSKSYSKRIVSCKPSFGFWSFQQATGLFSDFLYFLCWGWPECCSQRGRGVMFYYSSNCATTMPSLSTSTVEEKDNLWMSKWKECEYMFFVSVWNSVWKQLVFMGWKMWFSSTSSIRSLEAIIGPTVIDQRSKWFRTVVREWFLIFLCVHFLIHILNRQA